MRKVHAELAARATLPPESGRRGALLQALCEIAERVILFGVERAEGGAEDAPALARELGALVERALETLVAIEQLSEPPPDEYELAHAEEPQTWVGLRAAPSSQPRLADICFGGVLELNRVARGLSEAHDADRQLAAIESARRKLRRAIHAVLRLVQETTPAELAGRQHLLWRLDAELESALAVRRLYADFRRSLRRPEGEGGEAVLTALRYAAGALAALTASPHYVGVRVSDRTLLRRQRERLLEWSRAGKPISGGLQLLDDIWTCADLLRDINQRQELRAHDARLIRELLSDASREPHEWLAGLERLAGLDDALDALMARAKHEQGLELVMDAMVRLSFLA